MKLKIPNYACSALILATSFCVLPVYGQGDDNEINEVIISGYRASIESAKEAKRNDDTVIEAITPTEIGLFVDSSIADAMKRVPGVQIEQDFAGTDGDRVSIRGLGSEFVNSTINGRTLLSSGNEAKSLRKMNFNVFPSSVLSGVRIAKGQTAAGPEGGLAGQVDLQTARPLDLKQLENKRNFGLVTLRAEQRDLYDDDGSRVEALYGTRNEDATLGAFFAVVTGESDVAVDQINKKLKSGQ
jgi:iron complex outermembrane receptor protein